MMKKLLAAAALALALLTWASPTPAQSTLVTRHILYALYDLDATTDISCSFGSEVVTGGLATTSGSNTTTTSVSSSGVFGSIAVGDVIWAAISGSKTGRVVTARASADSATVDTAWTLPAAGVTLRYQKPTCAATGGWVTVGEGYSLMNFFINLSQVSLTSGGVGLKIEGRDSPISTAPAVNLWPGEDSADAKCSSGTFASGYCVFTAVASFSVTNSKVHVPYQVRLVSILTDTDDGTDTGADAEQLSAHVQVVK